MKNIENITKMVLCGFMGSGKTTYGEKLKLASPTFHLYDLDKEILESSSKTAGYTSLGDYIRNEGWEIFRSAESKILETILKNDTKTILSLGGGSLTESNLKLIKNNPSTLLVWIDTPFEECWRRIEGDENRPLTKHGYAKAEDLYYDRKPLYMRSDCILAPVQQNKLKSIEELLDFYRKLDESAISKA